MVWFKGKSMLNRHHLPFVIFVMIITFMWHGLGNTAEQFPLELLGKPVPAFSLENLNGEPTPVTEKIFTGKTTILEVFASYCRACSKQHEMMKSMLDPEEFQLIGLDYKDRKKPAQEWLRKHDNIYKVVIFDPTGKFGKSIDVYGTPTTYIIDKHGILRFRYFGQISPDKWKELVVPVLNKLKA